MTVTTIPSWIWEIDVDNAPGSVAETWEDITPFVRDTATIKRGRQVETGRDQAGTVGVDLYNGDRRFDYLFAGEIRNLVQNPSLETNITGYVAMGSATLSRSTAGGNVAGVASIQATVANVNGSGWSYGIGTGPSATIPVSTLTPYTFSVWIGQTSGVTKNCYIGISWWDVAENLLGVDSLTNISVTASMVRQRLTATSPLTVHHAKLILATSSAQGVFNLYADALQFEKASAATLYCDGTQDNCRWEYAPHESRSYFGGPYYGKIKPMRRIRWRSTYAATTYPTFYGYIDFPELSYPGFDAVAHITATDGFKVLEKAAVSGTFPAQKTHDRVNAILDAINWPAAKRGIFAGNTMLDPVTLDTVSALEHLQQVADSESGRLFMDASGQVIFIDRHSRYPTTAGPLFGEQEILYQSVQFSGSDELLYNDVRVTRAAEGAVTQISLDGPSQTDYFSRNLSYTGMLMDSDNEAKDKADFDLAVHKDYNPRVSALVLDGTYQPTLIWPHALGQQLTNRVTVRHRPVEGEAYNEQDAFIEGIEHTVGPGTWITVFRLSSAGVGYRTFPVGKNYFVLNDATNGVMSATGPGVLTY